MLASLTLNNVPLYNVQHFIIYKIYYIPKYKLIAEKFAT